METQKAIATFAEHLQTLNYSARTIRGYRQDLELFAKINHAMNQEVRKLRRSNVESFLRYSTEANRSPSPGYRNRRLSCLRSFFSFLKDQTHISSKDDPTRKFKFARVPNSEPTPLSYSEYLAILASIKSTASTVLRSRNWAIIVTLYNTGLRLSELVGLNVDQIDFANSRILRLVRKGGKTVDLPINQNVCSCLSEWIDHSDASAVGDALFTTQRKTRISARMVERLVAKYAKLAGISRSITPHTFRHSYCTEIQKRGVGMYVAQELMNHSSIVTTRRYSHANEEAMRSAVESLDDPKQWPDAKKSLTKVRPISYWANFSDAA